MACCSDCYNGKPLRSLLWPPSLFVLWFLRPPCCHPCHPCYQARGRAKELHLHKADPERKEKMLEARAKEWANWTGFEATKILSPSEAAEFRANNPEVDIIPTR